MATPKPYPHVLIIGGGLGGLTLAQALRKQGASFEVFDRDADETARLQGWAIGIHSVLGQLVAAFPNDMPPIAQTSHLTPLPLPAQMVLYSNERPGRRMGVQDDGTGFLVRANRHRLRDWLRTNVAVRFGKRAVRVEEGSGHVTVYFQDGTSATGDIVVGADGAHSMVRDYVTRGAAQLKDLPFATVTGELTLSGRQMAEQLELGHSTYLVRLAERPTLFVGLDRVDPDGKTGHYYWTVTFEDNEAVETDYWMKKEGGAAASKEELLAFAKGKTSLLDPRFRAIIDMTPAEGIKVPPFVYHDMVIEPRDFPAGRVTLLGDAAHTMTPFRGEGGVCAMRDALDLANAIARIRDADVQSGGGGGGSGSARFDQIMAEYRDVILERGSQMVLASRAALTQAAEIGVPRIVWGRTAVELPQEEITI